MYRSKSGTRNEIAATPLTARFVAVPGSVPLGTIKRNTQKQIDMFTTAIILETRTPRKDGTYPIKLRVILNRNARYFGLGYYLTEKEFNEAFSSKPRGRHKTIAEKCREQQTKAETILDNLDPLDLDRFKAVFTSKPSNKGGTVKKYFDQYIDELTNENRHGTASNYRCAMNCLTDFTNIEKLTFQQITPDFLKRYAAKMETDGKTPSTIGIYLRPLRHLYKKAQSRNEAPKNNPFGIDEGQFSIPTSEKHKRPLERSEIELLAAYKSVNPERVMYRDFFLLSYLLCGLNFADLLTIKWSQIDGNTLFVRRQKTKRNTKKVTLIELFISDQAQKIIDRYAKTGQTYIFDVINESDTTAEIHKKKQNFIRNCNAALKKIAQQLGINPKISTVYARHSAASHGVEAGATVADISAALGHTDIKTTSNYISSLKNGRQSLANSLQTEIPINKNQYEFENME
jgi:integrase/recombinase XerD